VRGRKLCSACKKGKVLHEEKWGREGIAPPFLNSAIDGHEWSASCPHHFTPREIPPGPIEEEIK
jgi:hypothetical protein